MTAGAMAVKRRFQGGALVRVQRRHRAFGHAYPDRLRGDKIRVILASTLPFAFVGPASGPEVLLGRLTVVSDDAQHAGGDGLAAFVADLSGWFERFSHAVSVEAVHWLRGSTVSRVPDRACRDPCPGARPCVSRGRCWSMVPRWS